MLERAWVALNRGKSASTQDFITLASRISGQNLRGFLNDWLYGWIDWLELATETTNEIGVHTIARVITDIDANDGQFRFNLVASNGQVVATSESYTRKRQRWRPSRRSRRTPVPPPSTTRPAPTDPPAMRNGQQHP